MQRISRKLAGTTRRETSLDAVEKVDALIHEPSRAGELLMRDLCGYTLRRLRRLATNATSSQAAVKRCARRCYQSELFFYRLSESACRIIIIIIIYSFNTVDIRNL